MKELKVLREAWLGDNEVVLAFKLQEEGRSLTSTIKEIAMLFPSLSLEEVKDVFIETAKELDIDAVGIEMGDYSSFELRIRTNKNKKAVKKAHKKGLKCLRKVFEKLQRMEEEKGLKGWLWEKKEFNLFE